MDSRNPATSLKSPESPPRPVFLTENLLRHSATIHCLTLLEERSRTQGDIVEALEPAFAADTVIDALGALVQGGYAVRFPAEGHPRAVGYAATEEGRALANKAVKESVRIPGGQDPEPRDDRASGAPAGA